MTLSRLASDIIYVDDTPVHNYFGLTYAQYLALPRTALQSMPTEWQHRFIQCLHELDVAIDWHPMAGEYWVSLRGKDGKLISITEDPLMDYERGRRRVKLNEPS